MSRIFGFGSAAVDFRVVTAELGENYREKLLARNIMRFDGGSAANALVQAARLGGDCVFLGKTGDDPLGLQIRRSLETENIDTSHIIVVPGAVSPFNVAVYAGEKRRRIGGFLLPNILVEITVGELEQWGDLLTADDWCLVELGEIPVPLVKEFCRIARARGAKTVLDVDLDPVRQCGTDQRSMEEIFSLCTLLAPNRDNISCLYGTSHPGELAGILCERFAVPTVITAGQDGAYWAEPRHREIHHQSAPVVDAVDTVGAGDAFHGGLLWALAQGFFLEDAIQTGCRCGAENCRSFGAREGMTRKLTFSK